MRVQWISFGRGQLRGARRQCLLRCAFAATLVAAAAGPAVSHAEEQAPRELKGVTIAEKLGNQLDLDLQFVDHHGKPARLRDFFRDGKPVLLTLNYYGCRMLCTLQLNALVAGLEELGWKPGEQFRIVTVSIDPRDTPAIARDKRENYLEALGAPDGDWSCLVASTRTAPPENRPPNVAKLADDVGFYYRYHKQGDQFAHAAAIFFLSPTGKVSRYLYGIEYPGRDIKFALMEASEGRVGSTVDRILLSCFHYDAAAGSYGAFAFGIMRLGGALTVVLLGGLLLVLWRRERVRRRSESAA